MSDDVLHSPLGKKSSYIAEYQPDLLFPIPRKLKRDEIHVPSSLPFKGVDTWTGYELSWLNAKGKPVVAIGEFIFPCESPYLIESKSFKLYLNSFNNSQFATMEDVAATLQNDLSLASGSAVQVTLFPLEQVAPSSLLTFSGFCLDELDIDCDTYVVNPAFLTCEAATAVTETLYSNLLKSNCLVTGQPDWGSVQITYTGKPISHAGLLKYIVSFRNHNEFHEQCVERIFMDILQHCQPQALTVHACYTRRGGLDINPFRSTHQLAPETRGRMARQ